MSLLIPTRSDLPYFDLQVTLDSTTYTLTFRWNVRAAAWFVGVASEDGQTVYAVGSRLVADFPFLLRRTGRQPAGWLLCADTSGQGLDPGIADLGTRCQVFYLTAADLGLAPAGAVPVSAADAAALGLSGAAVYVGPRGLPGGAGAPGVAGVAGVAGAVGPAGPAGSSLLWSPVDLYYGFGQAGAASGSGWGSETTGVRFYTLKDKSCTGMRFVWPGYGASRTIRCALTKRRPGAPTRLATIDVPVSPGGSPLSVSVTWPAPVTCTKYDPYYVSIWETSGQDYVDMAWGSEIIPTFPLYGGSDLIWCSWYCNNMADTDPIYDGNTTKFHPMEPVFA